MDINQRIEIADENLSNAEFVPNPTVIKVVGVGNGGCNAVNRMIEEGLSGVSFIAMNTDAQQLAHSKANVKVVLGREITGGLGAGTDPERGAEAARRDEKKIAAMLEGANLVFVASGFGGGTGTGASPIVASIAKASGALTIGVVTKPFEMEGQLRMTRAEKGIEQMSNGVDSLIVIPNENLNGMFDEDITFEDSLKVVDDILRQAVQGISDIIMETGFGMNVDFADVQTMIKNSDGRAHLGIGYGKGERRIDKAVTNAFNNPLLDVENIRNASGILANIVCPKDFSLREHKEAMKIIHHYASDNANIKVGVCQKEEMLDEMRVTIIATGFEHGKVIDATANESETISSRDSNSSSDSDSRYESQTTNSRTHGYLYDNDDDKGDSIVSRSLSKTKDILERTKQIEEIQTKIEPEAENASKTESLYAHSSTANANNSNSSSTEESRTSSQTEHDQDIQEAINIANSIKNSPTRAYVDNPMPVIPAEPIQKPAQDDNMESMSAANNTHGSRVNSDHVVEQQQYSSQYGYSGAQPNQQANEGMVQATTRNDGFVQASTSAPYNPEPSYQASVPENRAPIVEQAQPQLEPPQQQAYDQNGGYVNSSLNSLSPHSGQQYSEGYNYVAGSSYNDNIDLAPQDEVASGGDLFDRDEPQIYDDTDIDTPAFLRRVIQTKK